MSDGWEFSLIGILVAVVSFFLLRGVWATEGIPVLHGFGFGVSFSIV